MANESETDAAGIPWLLSPEWTPGKPTGRARRLIISPKEAFAEIHYLFSELDHRFGSRLPLKFEGGEPATDRAYVEIRYHMMKLQALCDELSALNVSNEDQNDKQGLAITIRGAILKAEGYAKQKKALELNHEEHSQIYRDAKIWQRAKKARGT